MRLEELTPAIRSARVGVTSVFYRAGSLDGPLRKGVAQAYRNIVEAYLMLDIPIRDENHDWKPYAERAILVLNDLVEEMKDVRDRKRLESYYDIRRDALAHEAYMKLQALVQAIEEATGTNKED